MDVDICIQLSTVSFCLAGQVNNNNNMLSNGSNNKKKISADADGGPHSRVRTAGHSAQPHIDVSGNFSAHVLSQTA